MIRLILFDLDGTLIERPGPWLRCADDYMARHPRVFTPEARVRVLEGLDRTARRPFLDRFMVGRVVARVFPGLGTSPDRIAADLAARLPGFVEPDPAVLGVLADLSGRYRTAVVTNGSRRVQRPKVRRAGLAGAVGRVFVSGEMGVRKPDPEFFRRVLAWAGVAPGDALIVGDHPYEDILGGQRAGLLTCAVGPFYDADWPEPDFRVDRVADLPGVLG